MITERDILMALLSTLFRGDALLEAALVSDPAHITPGARGPHVTKIQQALNTLDDADIIEDAVYGRATADAVLAYKRKRNIINRRYQTQADNIVGKMTIPSPCRRSGSSREPRGRSVSSTARAGRCSA
jgi:peptidoglycan hydrolase-like protein with peptidoglycan-binding domain